MTIGARCDQTTKPLDGGGQRPTLAIELASTIIYENAHHAATLTLAA